MEKVKIYAFYLPQFHPIPENDLWWGKGFTDWTNVTKANPLYKGHKQPKLPSDLGLYDLRIPEVREAQAKLAQEYGIDGFCYWHYWFGNGKKLLERPFNEVLKSGKPDFSFSLAWANISWGGLPYGDLFERRLIEQQYPGDHDDKAHFYSLLDAFRDKRYIRINNKPIFTIYNPAGLPDSNYFINYWNKLARENGLDGIYFIAYQHLNFDYKAAGFEALVLPSPSHLIKRIKLSFLDKVLKKLFDVRWINFKYRSFKLKQLYSHKEIVDASDYSGVATNIKFFPSLIPNWDHSPRSLYKAQVIVDSNPDCFYENLCNCYKRIKNYPDPEKIIFIKAWNEWAEGNYLEPDHEYGHSYLEAVKKFKEQL
jgi:Glycosyltransferase WbsX